MSSNERIGLRIAEVRRARRLIQEDFADLIGVSRTYAQNIEHGRKGVTAERLDTIANVLECRPADLWAAPGSPIPRRVAGIIRWPNYQRLMGRLHREHPAALICCGYHPPMGAIGPDAEN